ncbi:MAG: hypothetical protein WCI67_22740 [Chloroflexales bacterium]
MSLKPQPSRLMPEELARLGALLLPADSPYRLIGDRLYARYDNADFVDLYHVEGSPGLPPFVCLHTLRVRWPCRCDRCREYFRQGTRKCATLPGCRLVGRLG